MREMYSLSLERRWAQVNEARTRVVAAMRDVLAPDELEAIEMATAELVENAVKYGSASPNGEPTAELRVHVSREAVVLEMRTYCATPSRYEALLEIVNRTSSPARARDEYVDALQQTLQGRRAPGQIGILRLVFEGDFVVTCRRDGLVVTVEARRPRALPHDASPEPPPADVLDAEILLERGPLRLVRVPPDTVRFEGDLSEHELILAVGSVLRSLHEQLRGQPARVELDVTALRFVSSTGIRLFLDWFRWIGEEPAERRYRILARIDTRLRWQASTFAVLGALAGAWLEVSDVGHAPSAP